MRDGIVVMLDALGFKRIWKHVDPDKVLEKMIALRAKAEASNDVKLPGLEVKVACISDTLALGVTSGELRASMNIASNLTHNLIQLGAESDPPLAYRGVACCGQFDMRQGFIIGPAVDEAAVLMEAADAAIVWCAPSAALVAEEAMVLTRIVLERYDVPFKDGRTFRTIAVRPVALASEAAHAARIRERILASFDREADVSVMIKKQNTVRFLDAMSTIPLPTS